MGNTYGCNTLDTCSSDHPIDTAAFTTIERDEFNRAKRRHLTEHVVSRCDSEKRESERELMRVAAAQDKRQFCSLARVRSMGRLLAHQVSFGHSTAEGGTEDDAHLYSSCLFGLAGLAQRSMWAANDICKNSTQVSFPVHLYELR
jgi:hypothetical protein